jgi:diguanylate cyclase
VINYDLLPDLAAMTILMVILFLLRRRHPGKSVDLWLLGLFFILIETIAHAFYSSAVPLHRTLHTIQLDAYVLAGVAFTSDAGLETLSRRNRFGYLALNTIPILCVLTFRGFTWNAQLPYDLAILTGLLMGVATGFLFRRSWSLIVVHIACWLPMAWLIHQNYFRGAAYWGLVCLYILAGLSFQKSLPSKSTGKIAIMGGFFVWALCFLVHPWVPIYSHWDNLVTQVWNMQKFLISIGMLIVMLEDQITSNEWLALHDQLTDLANRRLFEDRLVQALERSRRMNTRVVLIMIDLDGFKKINDAYGHLAGDDVLRGVSTNLRETVRASDTLARFGGDEFVVLASDLPAYLIEDNLGNPYSLRLVAAIETALAKPVLVNGRNIVVSGCLGVAIAPDDANLPSQLLQIADKRMYKLKQQTTATPTPDSAPTTLAPYNLDPNSVQS